MKKKILFMIINMNVGGTEKALLNMISVMPKEQYDITLLMLEKNGGYLNYIPNWVNLEYLESYDKIKGLINNPPRVSSLDFLRKGKVIDALNIMAIHLISKWINNRSVFFNYIFKKHSYKLVEYDIAVAYAGPMDFISYFVLNKVNAKKKIQWIHFDITKIGFNKKYAEKIYKKFDKIFVVSNEAKSKLDKKLPVIKDKTEKFLNIISPNLINKMANDGKGFETEEEFNGLKILTVGRLSKEKGQDLTISVMAKLKSSGYNVRWYCIGDGSSRNEYEKLIKSYSIEDSYILLGANPNPYPYMKNCDIYVQPSRHEGYCITLAEARCFDNPIICTNFTGANEQIRNYETGIIVDFDKHQLYEAITQIINEEKLRREIKRNLLSENTDTTFEIEKLYSFANNKG